MISSSKNRIQRIANQSFGWLVMLFFLLALHPSASAQRVYKPEEVPNVQLQDSTRLVTDEAGLLSQAQEEAMNRQLRAIRSTHGVEFAVVTLPSIGDAGLEDFSLALARHWGIGKEKHNNGLLLLLVLDIRRVRFETGYGLEGYLPDGRLSRIIHDDMIPHFRSGNYAEGLSEGVQAVQQVLDGTYDVKPDGSDSSSESISWGFIITVYCILLTLVTLGVLYQFTSYRKRHPHATAIEEYEYIRRQLLAMGCVFLLLFPPGFLVVLLIAKARQAKLKKEITLCPQCHNHTVGLLSGSADINHYLTPQQQMERNLNSRDFKVYACSSCNHAQVIVYDRPGTTYKRCPACGTVALQYIGERRVRTNQGPMIQKEWRCLYCGENHKQQYRDNSELEAAAAGVLLGSLLGRGGRGGGFGGGFGGGGFGGGSFGGGSFGGGGASGGW